MKSTRNDSRNEHLEIGISSLLVKTQKMKKILGIKTEKKRYTTTLTNDKTKNKSQLLHIVHQVYDDDKKKNKKNTNSPIP